MTDWRLVIEPVEDGKFVGTSPDVQGLVVQADSREEVARLAEQLVEQLHEMDQEQP